MITTYPKKLIEVALPLPEINDASSYDKMPGIGPHPKGIHHWWARLPLPSARAVLFASVVTDPSDDPAWKNKSEAEQDVERERLFGILRRLMGKRLHEHPEVYEEAHREMLKHCDGKLPPVLDPFSGGGSIPLEAARLGFEAHAADLNPVAVLLNKCNLELAPRWVGHAPVNPNDRERDIGTQVWTGTKGLAADVRFYGQLIQERAIKKIGHLYPKVKLPAEHGGGEANVISYLWSRTVESPSPAFSGSMTPLVGNFLISTTKGNEAYVQPVVSGKSCSFSVTKGVPSDAKRAKGGTGFLKPDGKKTKATFQCVFSGDPINGVFIDAKAEKGGIDFMPMAVVADGGRRRLYLDANSYPFDFINSETEKLLATPEIAECLPTEACRGTFASNAQGRRYGFNTFSDYFLPRQLVTAATLTLLIREAITEIEAQAIQAGMPPESAKSYSQTVVTFLALALDRCLDFNNSLTRWSPSNQKPMNLFSKHAIAMVWDFAEANPLGESVGGWVTCSNYAADCIAVLCVGTEAKCGDAAQIDAAAVSKETERLLISTDPPYYDNISYSSLSDFFYVWLRRTIGDLYPEIMGTMLVPKLPELTASPEKFDADKVKAKEHFESGFKRAFADMHARLDPRFPLTVYYAFKQEDDEDSEEEDGEVNLTTGWETLLEALVSSEFTITATWPVRASQTWRMVSMGANALASYIVLACRPRSADAQRVGRNAFVAELKRELPPALRHLQQGNVAPVDFAQAAIGPGMAVFSRYSAVLESSGKPMTVRTVLSIINGMKDELLGESIEELDKDTRWAVQWFGEDGFEWGDSGKANLLANAQATALNGLVATGILEVKGSNVRLIAPEALPSNWDPDKDQRLTVWEMTHHLLRVYYHERKGDPATAALLRKLGTKAEVARDLAYKLFTVCENRKWSREAQAYNALVMGWSELTRLAREVTIPAAPAAPTTGELF